MLPFTQAHRAGGPLARCAGAVADARRRGAGVQPTPARIRRARGRGRAHQPVAAEALAELPLLQQSTRPYGWRQWFDAMGWMLRTPWMARGMSCSPCWPWPPHGMGVALMPPLLIEAELASGELVVACNRPLRGERAYYFISPAQAQPPVLTTFAQWLQTMAQTATSAAGQAGGAGDRLTSVDGRVLGVTASFGRDRPSRPITPAAHFGTPLPYPDAPIAVIARSHRACTVVSFHSAWRTFALVACVLFLQGCSAVKLAYNQAPQLVYWRLNNYFNLTEAQADRLRSELGDLHQWHRDQMLPQHAVLLQQVQQRLADDITADQACRVYADVRLQIDQLIAQVEPGSSCFPSQLTESQIPELRKTTNVDSNADWRRSGWMCQPTNWLRIVQVAVVAG